MTRPVAGEVRNLAAVVLADVVGSAAIAGRRHQLMRRDLYEVMGGAVGRRGIDLPSLCPDDTGDGMRLIIPVTSMPPTEVVDVFVLGLLAELRLHWRYTAEDVRIRLRVAFDLGLVERHLDHWVGEPLVRAQRLIDAEPLRAALRLDRRLALAAVVSDDMYRSVVEPGDGYVPAGCFRRIQAQVKEFDAGAWLLTPETPWQCRSCLSDAA